MLNFNSLHLQDLHQHAQGDQEYQQLQHYIITGFPEHQHQLLEQCGGYWNIRSHLALDDGLIVYGCRLVVSTAMRLQIRQELHASHQGTLHIKMIAKLIVFGLE